jgi:long-chain acyl-CoA synthetase
MQSKRTLGHLLNDKVSRFQHKNAVGWIENKQIRFFNFQDYKNTIECLALGLKKNNLEALKPLAILATTSKEWHFIDFASLCSRSTVIPIYPSYTPDEVLYILNHSESTHLVVEDNVQFEKVLKIQDQTEHLKTIINIKEIDEVLKEQLDDSYTLISYKEIISTGANEVKEQSGSLDELIDSCEEDDIATIVYTSGTTGVPKGAIITQKAFWSMLNNTALGTEGAFSEKDRTLVFLPLSHVLARCDSYLCSLFGWEMVFAESIDKIMDNIKLAKPTVMVGVPRIFEKIYQGIMAKVEKSNIAQRKLFDWAIKASEKYYEIIDQDRIPATQDIVQKELAYNIVFKKIYENFGGRIRFFVTGGAPLAMDIIKFLRNARLTILEGYGLTETVGPCFLNPLFKQKPGTVGMPLGDTQVKFADDGEILLKSSGMFSEYYKMEEGLGFKDGWFCTGDIGEFDPEGFLKITDRKKDIIITSGGKNVAPQKIENIMKTQKYISHFVVIGDKRKYLTALVGIEKDRFMDILKELDLTPGDNHKKFAKSQAIRDLIMKDVQAGNSQLASFETIKKFEILPIELSSDNYLTPSLKIKKKPILKDYAELIEKMY